MGPKPNKVKFYISPRGADGTQTKQSQKKLKMRCWDVWNSKYMGAPESHNALGGGDRVRSALGKTLRPSPLSSIKTYQD